MNESLLQFIKDKLVKNFDVKYREIQSSLGLIYAIFIDNMCDSKFISENIVAPLINEKNLQPDINFVKGQVLYANNIGDVKNREEALLHILSGDLVLIFTFIPEVIYCDAKGFGKRSIEMPITEAQIKGPRDGFIESINDNISLIRRRIKTPNLKFENFLIGDNTKTSVVLVYIDGEAPSKLVDYIKSQLRSMKTKAITNLNEIEEKLKCKGTAFDTIGYSEKPDSIIPRILEGRIAVLVDGSPFVLTAPFFFIENLHNGDDYYFNIFFGNGTRLLRWIAFLITTLLPAFYIAVVTHHFSLIPYMFTFRMAISRAGVPFPTIVEVFLMAFFFQLSREAGIRLPQPIGQAMSIVGALILGDATVGSGLASQTTLIIVAVSSICSFLVPKLNSATTTWSVIITVFAAILGLPGFYIGFCIFISHLAGLNSCGYPYLFPFGTLREYRHRDVVTRTYLRDISNNIFEEDES